MSYINAWCHWVEGGNKWKCNLCKHETPGMFGISLTVQLVNIEAAVSPEYFSNLGPNGLRLDHMNRPELMKGTVDFDVTEVEQYWASNPPSHITRPFFSIDPPAHGSRKPENLRSIFVLDVSAEAIQSGFIFEACTSILTLLSSGAYLPASEIAIMTVDREVHFYDLSVRDFLFLVRYRRSDLIAQSDQVPMLVVSDVDEMFLPLQQDCLFLSPVDNVFVPCSYISNLSLTCSLVIGLKAC